jgi:hypothetical protein
MEKLLIVVDYQVDFVVGALGFKGSENTGAPHRLGSFIPLKTRAMKSSSPRTFMRTIIFMKKKAGTFRSRIA